MQRVAVGALGRLQKRRVFLLQSNGRCWRPVSR